MCCQKARSHSWQKDVPGCNTETRSDKFISIRQKTKLMANTSGFHSKVYLARQFLRYATTRDRNNCVHENRLTRTTDLLPRTRTFKYELTHLHNKRLSESLVSGLTADVTSASTSLSVHRHPVGIDESPRSSTNPSIINLRVRSKSKR